MKKIFFISGITSGSLAVILLILSLTGIIDFSVSKRDAVLAEGNRLMVTGSYLEALEVYERGLEEYPGDPELNYNTGQALYGMGDYSRAAEYYAKSTVSKPERYLNLGNCSLKQYDYRQAAELYKQGILEFPQDVPLKYNYEYAMYQISQMEQSGEGGEGEQSGDSESEQGGSSGNESKQSGGSENEQSGGSENEQGNGSEGEQGNGSEGEQGNDTEKEQGSSGEQGGSIDVAPSSGDGSAEQKQARSIIENVLEALEKQEAESLKNNRNQEYIYEEGNYEW